MPDGTATHSFPVTSAETNGSPEVPTCRRLRPIRFQHPRTPPWYRSCRQAEFVAKPAIRTHNDSLRCHATQLLWNHATVAAALAWDRSPAAILSLGQVAL